VKGSRRQLRGRGRDAVWELRVSAGKDPVTGKYRYLSKTFHGTANAADEALRLMVDEVTGGGHDPNQSSLGSLLDRWVAHAEVLKDLSPTTVREYKRLTAKTIKPALGDVPLRSIDGKTLDSFYTSLRTGNESKMPLSASSVRRVHALISVACGQAVKWGELRDNPARAATPPAVRTTPKDVPTPETVQALIRAAAAEDEDMATLIALAAATGARRGELCGLRWGDWDRSGGTLTIERSVVAVNGELIVKPTKTHGVRRLACDPFTEEVLLHHLATMEQRGDEDGVLLTSDSPILSYDLEHPIHPDTASHYVRALAKKAGVDLHLHQLRHGNATRLIGDGHDVRTVAGRLGHRDASTTLRVYAHALPERDREAAAAIGRSLTPKRTS
jgi:integrase